MNSRTFARLRAKLIEDARDTINTIGEGQGESPVFDLAKAIEAYNQATTIDDLARAAKSAGYSYDDFIEVFFNVCFPHERMLDPGKWDT